MSARPYVDRPIVDGVAAAALARTAAAAWGLPAPSLMRIGMNAIFEAGDTVLRVAAPTAPAAASLALSRTLRAAGVAVAEPAHDEVVEDDGLSVTAWPFLRSVDDRVDWVDVGRSLRRVHQLDPADLPEQLPRPTPIDFPWWDFAGLLDDVASRLDAGALDGIRKALDRNAGWDSFQPSDVVVCHGDVHPGNVIQTADGAVLIDWDLLCLAPAGWDHGPMMTWTERWGGPPGVYEALADGYGASLIDDPWAGRFAELRLVAATLMRVKASMRDQAAWPEAERRLRHWRGDADAPIWRAV